MLKQLRAKEYAPVYCFHGPESYFIDQLTDYIADKVLAEHEKAFNQTIVYGKEVDHLAILDAARRFPMMAERQVVILKEAQEMRTLKELKAYIEKPAPTTILVIAHKHKNLNLNSGLGKALKEKAVIFNARSLYDNQLADWILKLLEAKKRTIQPAAAELMAEYLGTELSKIANEIDKLALNVAEGTTITPQLVEQHIGISKDYNVFELQKALAQKDVLKANRIITYFAANPGKNPEVVVISTLYNYFSKVYLLHGLRGAAEGEILQALGLRSNWFLSEYRLAARQYSPAKTIEIIGLLREYDLKSKGVDYISTGKANGELLKELVWKILH